MACIDGGKHVVLDRVTWQAFEDKACEPCVKCGRFIA